MITIRFSTLRKALVGVLLALCALTPAQADPARPTNTVFPAYPVDTAGCSALKNGGPFNAAFDTDSIRKAVSGGVGMRFTAFILPDTPFFRFYANNEAAFFYARYSEFPASMQCFIRAVYGSDSLLRFAGLPPGHYIVLERTDETVTYVGDDEGESVEPEQHPTYNNGTGESGMETDMVTRTTHTPVWKQYVRTALLGVNLIISTNGSESASGPKVLYLEGY